MAKKILIGLAVVAAIVGVVLLVMRRQGGTPFDAFFAKFLGPGNPFGRAPLPQPATSARPGPQPTAPGAVGRALNGIQTGAQQVKNTANDINTAARALKDLRDAFLGKTTAPHGPTEDELFP